MNAELLEKLKAELKKLEDIDNELVKEVLSNVNTVFAEIESTPSVEEEQKVIVEETTEEATEEINEEEDTETTLDQTQEEVENDSDSKTEEQEEKEEVLEESKEFENKFAIELSAEVADKLQIAAIELEKSSNEIKIKDEIIELYKTQITELKEKISAFEKEKSIELKKRFDEKAGKLIELYANLGIKKDAKEIELNFTESQIDKLIKDLSIVELQKKEKRQTSVNQSFELKNGEQVSQKKSSAKILFEALGM